MRFTVPEDVDACVALEPTAFGYAKNHGLQKVCADALKKLPHSQRALCVVVVNDADKPVAFGMSMFITDETRERLIGVQGERQLIWQELCQAVQEASEARGRRRTPHPILNPREVVRAHQGKGLNFLGFYGWRDDLSPDEKAQVMFLLWESFMLLHKGYHLKSFLKEVYGEQERDYYVGMGMQAYKEPSHYRQAVHGHQPYLVGITCEEVRPSARAFDLFKTPAPRVKLTPRMREVAQLVCLFNLSDGEIAGCLTHRRRRTRSLGVSDSDVRWIWSRMRRYLPVQNGSGNPSRARDGCLGYIRCHPEVIYPLQIHGHFYLHPELAQQYPLPLSDGTPQAVVQHFRTVTASSSWSVPE